MIWTVSADIWGADQAMSHAARKSDKADLSHTRILDAAARLFSNQGYASVSLRAIATAAGMKAGSVYYHFESKQAIVIEILDLGISVVHEEVRETIENLPEGVSAAETIRVGILAHLRAMFEFSDYTSANVRIYGQVPAPVRTANLEARRSYEALWDRILLRVAQQGGVRGPVDLKAFRLVLIGSLNATIEWFDAKRGNLEELANNYADILLHGLLSQVGPDQ